MAGKAENITDYVEANADWDTIFKNVPSSSVGEFAGDGTDPFYPDLNATTFSETSRTPYDGDTSRDQSHFPTRNSGKQS